MSEDPKEPKLKAGDPIVSSCPVCNVKFSEPVETNVSHDCPNPQCAVKFSVMVFEN